MKLIALVLFFLLCCYSLLAQNLVPNPSFEEYTDCPNEQDQVYLADGWHSYSVSPDYFNSCSTNPDYGVPINVFGNQNAATGEAYCGFFTYSIVKNYREYIGRNLLDKLKIGQKYYISIKVNLAEESVCETDNIGILLSTVPFRDSSAVTIINYAQAYSHDIVKDKTNWRIVSGSFIADSAYQYIIVGNFFNDALTNKMKWSDVLGQLFCKVKFVSIIYMGGTGGAHNF